MLSIEPKDENGQPVTDFTQRIIYDQYGNEVKEWYALAAYLQSFARMDCLNAIQARRGGKDVSQSWNPVELLKRPNWITLVALLVLILVAALVVVCPLGSAAPENRRYGGRGHRWRRNDDDPRRRGA